MTLRPIWIGALGGLVMSPLAIGLALLLRYVWPGFPLLRLLDGVAGFVVEPIAVLSGQPVVYDAVGNVESGLLSLLLAYAVVLVAWCVSGGLVGGAVWEQHRAGGAAPSPGAG